MIFRNILFYLGLIPVTIIFAVLGTVCFFLPYTQRYYFITRWSHFFIFWAKITCNLRFSVEGQEHLPLQNAIVFSNHQSMWETIFMQVLLPPQTWILKRELLSIPMFGWGLKLLQPIAINRKNFNSVKEVIRQGHERLTLGRWVIIFPEGTRVPPHAIRRYSKSGAALAEATGYPVVPIAHNAGLFWPKGYFIKRSGTVKVVIGPIIQTKDKTAEKINALAEHWIRQKVSELV